jgi:hypothetical protein
MPYMLTEIVILDEAILTVKFESESRYCLRYGDLVEYSNGRRRVRGRALPYEFRSVEQLRYDFEQDVRAAGGSLA